MNIHQQINANATNKHLFLFVNSLTLKGAKLNKVEFVRHLYREAWSRTNIYVTASKKMRHEKNLTGVERYLKSEL